MLASHVSVAISLMSALSVRPRTYFVSDSPSRKDMPSMIGLPTCLRLLTHGQLLAINAHKPCLIDITPSPTNNPSNQCDQSQSRPNIYTSSIYINMKYIYINMKYIHMNMKSGAS